MCTARLARWIGTLLAALFLSWPAAPQEAPHYSRFRDAKWYALQLQSLREELAKIDIDVRTLVEARKSGRSTGRKNRKQPAYANLTARKRT